MSEDNIFMGTGNNYIDHILYHVQEAARYHLTDDQICDIEDAAERAADAWERGVLCGKCGKDAVPPRRKG